MAGCVTPVIGPSVNAAAARVLARHGVEVVSAEGEACCGGIVHHMGREHEALAAARRNIDAWTGEIEGEGLDAIVITASGCGTTVKDYGFMFRNDPAYAAKAARISALGAGHQRIPGAYRFASAGRPARAGRGLSRRLLAPARSENHA